MGKRWQIILILLLGFALRTAGVVSESPPGLSHDEVANWRIDQQILAGEHGVYFTDAYGHEAGFHYLQAMSVRLVGNNVLALRMPAFFLGTLLIAIHYALIRKLFNRHIALISAGLLATTFWGIFFSRQGLRAIMLPVVSGLAAYFWIGIDNGGGRSDDRELIMRGGDTHFILHSSSFILSGVFAGLSLYTYMAARAVPIFFVTFVVYLGIWHRAWVMARWREIGLFFLVMGMVSLPLVLFLQGMPNAEFRIGEIDAPLRALYAGNLHPVLTNIIKNLGMFGFEGDPLWRQNVAGMPTFGVVGAVLFYAGIFLALLQWRNPRYAFLLLWIITGVIPSVVTINAPSSIRVINNLLFYATFPALTLHFIHDKIILSLIIPNLPTGQWKVWISRVTIITLLLLFGWHTYHSSKVLKAWAKTREVQFVWQAALTDMAHFLDSQPEVKSAGIAGWTPDSLDPPTMQLSTKRTDIQLAYFQPERTLIIPQSRPTIILHPAVLPLHLAIAGRLENAGIFPHPHPTFTTYPIPDTIDLTPATILSANFGNQLQLLGYDTLTQTTTTLEILTHWRVINPADGERRLFLHAIGTDPLIGDDGLSAPATHWQTGDYLIQHHKLTLPPNQTTTFYLGVYNPQTQQRLLLPTGKDHVSIH